MFEKDGFRPFENKIGLASPTKHGDELRYMTEAYQTNRMSTVGANINELERIAAEKAQRKHAVALCKGIYHGIRFGQSGNERLYRGGDAGCGGGYF